MNPQQIPNNNQNHDYPPQYGPNPQPNYSQPQQQPTQQPYQSQPVSYQQPPAGATQSPHQPQYQQPQPNYSQVPPQQPQQGPQQHPSWYQAPEPTKQDNAPSKASEYVSRATAPPTQTGQLVNGQYSVDYLSSMSGPSKGKISKMQMYIIGGILSAVLIATAAFVIFTPKQAEVPSATLSSVYSTMADTQDITKEAGKNIRSSQLRGINVSIDSTLLSTMQSLEAPLESSGNKPSNLRSAAKKDPIRDSELREKLEEARLLVMYDRVYLTQFTFKIEEIMRQIKYVQARTRSESTVQSLESGHDNLGALKSSLDNFANSSDSNSL